MIVVLDRQHVGKPGKRLSDQGASNDLNHAGVIEAEERESAFTAMYLFAAEMELRRLGHQCLPVSDGLYSARHQRVNGYAAGRPSETWVMVAAHLNSLTGGTRSGQSGNYGAVFWDHRSSPANGPALAAAIGEELGKLPELGANVRLWPARGDNWTKNAFSTIRHLGARVVGICFEPAFMDHADHRPLFTASGMERVGQALARGLHAWDLNRRTS